MELAEALAYEPRFRKLNQRQDNDLLKYYLDEYTMKDSHNAPLPNVENITLNDPRTYADRVIADLTAASMKFTVSDCEPRFHHDIEQYYRRTFEDNDYNLSLQEIEELNFALNWYGCIRGWIATRTLVYKDVNSGLSFIEIMPLDTRWMKWAADRQGTVWALTEATMTKDEILASYGKKIESAQTTVYELWTRSDFKVYQGTGTLLTDPIVHNIGHCPVSVLPVPSQPTAPRGVQGIGRVEDEGLLRRGESIYAANRDVYDKLNALASTWATMNKMQFMSPIAFVSAKGRKLAIRPYGLGIVMNLKEGEKFIELPTKEMTASGQALFGQLSAAAQRGSLSNIDYGHLSFELSAVAIAKLTGERNQITLPRLKANAAMYKRICQSIKAQTLGNGYNTQITEADPVSKLDSTVLNRPFRINVSFHSLSPEQNVANATVANSYKGLLSKRSILQRVVQVEDLEGEIDQLEIENAHAEIPELRLYDYAMKLNPTKDIEEAELNLARSNIIFWKLAQITQGAVQPPAAAKQLPSQASPMIRMPGVPETHIAREEARRIGIGQKEKEQTAATTEEENV